MNLPIDQQNIINILGIESLPDDRKMALIDQMTDLVQKRLLVRILDSLQDTKREELLAMLEKDDSEALKSFLAANVPDMADWLMEEVNKIKVEMADLAKNV